MCNSPAHAWECVLCDISYLVCFCNFQLSTALLVVGFVETSFTVTEGGSVDVCVQLISPEGNIGDAQVNLEVIDEVPPFIPADVARAS